MITITCTDSGHAPRVAKLAQFSRSADHGWTLDPPSPRLRASGGRRWDDYVRLAEPAQALLGDGDAPVREARGNDWRAVRAGEARERFVMRCKLCGANLPVRAETLAPILDKADTRGVSEIPLVALAAMLRPTVGPESEAPSPDDQPPTSGGSER